MAQPLQQFEQYTLLGDIAAGGMGVVYQAVHQGLKRSCALKLIRTGLLATPDERRRFVTEAEAASTLDHPGIVRVRRAGEFQGQWFLEMELIEGGTLADRLAEGPLEPKAAARLLEGLARAVQHAHERGVLHRDLKPANVLLDPAGEPKLADFGLARFLGRSSDLTRTLAVLGTPAYMAPELASGRARDATVTADIYSLGVILFECLTGERPFKGLTPLEILRAVQETPTPHPSSVRPHLPRDLEVITLRCLAREPERRFPSAGELADELSRFLRGEPIRSRMVPPLERLWLWGRRHPRLALAAGCAALATTLGAAGVLWQWRRAEKANANLEHRLASEALQDAARQHEGGDRVAALVRVMRAMRETPGQPALARWLHARLLQDSSLVLQREFSHPGEVGFVRFDPAHRRLVTAGQAGVRVFDRDSGALVAQLEATKDMWEAYPGSDGDCVLAVAKGESVRLWKLAGSAAPRLLWQATGTVQVAVAPNRSRFAVADSGGQVWVRTFSSVSGAERTAKLPTAPGVIAFSGDGSMLATALADGTIMVLSPGTNDWSRLAKVPQTVVALALRPDGQTVVAASLDGFAAWRVRDGARVFTQERDLTGRHIAFSPDGRLAALAEMDGRIEVLNLTQTPVTSEGLAPVVALESLAFTASGRQLLAIGNDGTTRVIALSPLRVIAAASQPGFAWNADFDDADGFLLTSASDGNARLFRLTPAGTNATFVTPHSITAAASVPGHRALAVLTEEGDLLRLESSNQTANATRLGSFPSPAALAIAEKPGPVAFVASTNGCLSRLAIEPPTPPRQFLTLSATARLLSASSDGQSLVAADAQAVTLIGLEPEGGRIRTNWALPSVVSLAFSPGGQHLAAGCYHGAIAVFDVLAGQIRWTNTVLLGPVWGLAFSPDGRRLVTASQDKTVRVWEVGTGRPVLPQLEQRTDTFSVAVSHSGTTVAIGSDREVSVWEILRGQNLARLPLPGNRSVSLRLASAVSFSPDDTRLLAADSLGHFAVWDVSVPVLLAEEMLTLPQRNATRSRAFWLDDTLAVAWSFSGVVKFVDLPAPPPTPLLVQLAEWITAQAVDDHGAVIRLDEAARAERLSHLRAATASGTLPLTFARYFPTNRPQ